MQTIQLKPINDISDLGPDADQHDVDAYEEVLSEVLSKHGYEIEYTSHPEELDLDVRALVDAIHAGEHGDWVAAAARARAEIRARDLIG